MPSSSKTQTDALNSAENGHLHPPKPSFPPVSTALTPIEQLFKFFKERAPIEVAELMTCKRHRGLLLGFDEHINVVLKDNKRGLQKQPRMLRVRLPAPPGESAEDTVALSVFVAAFLDRVMYELNAILCDYRSIQEHAHRNRLIEFAEQKRKDLSLLLLAVRGAALFAPLQRRMRKGRACAAQGAQLVSIADYLAGLSAAMSSSFIPRHDIRLALQAHADPAKLFPQGPDWQILQLAGDTPEKPLPDGRAEAPVDMHEITRLMKIYMLREGVTNYTIRDGVLYLASPYFTFRLVLCGSHCAPVWRILGIDDPQNDGAPVSAEEEEALVSTLHPKISEIVAFGEFYANRRRATEVFKMLTSEQSGFFKKFSGRVGTAAVHGRLESGRFLCTVENAGQTKTFINCGAEAIRPFLEMPARAEPEHGDYIEQGAWGHLREVLGSGYVLTTARLLACFYPGQWHAVVGQHPAARRLSGRLLGLRLCHGEAAGSPGGANNAGEDTYLAGQFPPSQEEHSPAATLLYKQLFSALADAFVAANLSVLEPAYRLMHTIELHAQLCGSSAAHVEIAQGILVVYTGETEYRIESATEEELEDRMALTDRLNLYATADLARQKVVHRGNMQETVRFVEQEMLRASSGPWISLKDATRELRDADTEEAYAHLILQFREMELTILNGGAKTSCKPLEEACRGYGPVAAALFAARFGIFYEKGIWPAMRSLQEILIEVGTAAKSWLCVQWAENSYRFVGEQSREALRLPETVEASLESPLHEAPWLSIIQHAAVASRLHRLACLVTRQIDTGQAAPVTAVKLPGDCTVTKEDARLVVRSKSGTVERELTELVNNTADLLTFVQNCTNGR